jgi:hypothetical protein
VLYLVALRRDEEVMCLLVLDGPAVRDIAGREGSKVRENAVVA